LAINDANADLTCSPVLKYPGLADKTLAGVKYETAKTAKIDSITPRLGNEYGGTTVVIAGSGFSTTASENKVYIDTKECLVSTSTATAVTCVT